MKNLMILICDDGAASVRLEISKNRSFVIWTDSQTFISEFPALVSSKQLREDLTEFDVLNRKTIHPQRGEI